VRVEGSPVNVADSFLV